MRRGFLIGSALAMFVVACGAAAGDLVPYPNKPGKKSGPTGKIGAVAGPAPPAAPEVVLGAAGRLGTGEGADYGFVAAPDAGPAKPEVEVGFRAETRFRNKGPGS